METTYTYYAPTNNPADLVCVYDSENSNNSANYLQDPDAKEAWWVDGDGNKHLMWKKVNKTVKYLYYGGLTIGEIDSL